jgi:hypothetical protein
MQLPLLDRFEEACVSAKVKPTTVLRAAGIHASLWWKWKAGGVSPTLRNFEAAVAKLEEMGGDTCQCGGNCKPARRKN